MVVGLAVSGDGSEDESLTVAIETRWWTGEIRRPTRYRGERTRDVGGRASGEISGRAGQGRGRYRVVVPKHGGDAVRVGDGVVDFHLALAYWAELDVDGKDPG